MFTYIECCNKTSISDFELDISKNFERIKSEKSFSQYMYSSSNDLRLKSFRVIIYNL
jgi:hypothetical protein